ncbi:MAG: hypothetical protein N4A76_08640 [Firmicutes bacterium]|jgi:hypothetical protein|nr:hypothetical protein [Bacillota bacterium]
MRKRIKSNKRRESIAYKFLKSSTGYGYMPSKALSFAFKTILLYSLLYFGIDIIGYLIRNPFPKVTLSLLGEVFEKFVLTTYQSGITYTTIGFEDLLSTNPCIGLVYVSEAIIGVSTLSLFVVALTKKYFFGKN